ncbi:Large ribosomal subunit protein uL15m [Nakaseomyces bracarensis]|uniref:Large ribosomal subunit protein uL15m n=1 Tax=Nakaseomyces bracarensis TaxID=273131 RepID=A0ABR4NLS8_9SACH
MLGLVSAKRFAGILARLRPADGATQGFKRLGRGPSSGKGKTSGRGQKGQKARGKVKSWFEGGQTPIYKLFPKIGFTNVHARPLKVLNLARVQEFYDKGRLPLQPGEVLDIKCMKDTGLVTGPIRDGVKVLARGQFKYNVPFKVEASRASQKAIRAIEGAGGSFVARYFSRLGLRAHLVPQWFIRKRGRLPLPARPVKRKDIDFYSKPEKRGYLALENSPYLQTIRDAQKKGSMKKERTRVKKSALDLQLESLASDFIPPRSKSKTLSKK